MSDIIQIGDTVRSYDFPDYCNTTCYIGGSVDAWIVERDVGDSKYQAEIDPQHQAFGPITLRGESIGESEWGYISIQELIDNGVELDLYWTPKPVREVK